MMLRWVEINRLVAELMVSGYNGYNKDSKNSKKLKDRNWLMATKAESR